MEASVPGLLSLLLLLACHRPQRLAEGARCLTAFGSDGRRYDRCIDLPTQGASIAWTLFPHNRTLDIVFFGSLPSPSGWIAWGINPEAPGRMVGTRALIAFRDPWGSPTVLPYYIDAAVKAQKVPLVSQRTADVDVLRAAVELTPSRARIFATLRLPGSNRTSALNHVWNRGVYVQGYSPTIHGTNPEDLASAKTVDMSSGRVSPGKKNIPNNNYYYSLRTAHGVLNGMSWGFLLPVGAACARYLRPLECLDPAWFYVHVALQVTGYAAGATGWALGLRLGSMSPGGAAGRGFHRSLGAVIFALGTLQMLALLFRPKKAHRLRKYWKSYHHFVGYACVVVGVVNVFQGIDLLRLEPGSYVKMGYGLVVASVIGVCVVLEVNSWVVFLKSRNAEEAAAAAAKMAARPDGRRAVKYGNV